MNTAIHWAQDCLLFGAVAVVVVGAWWLWGARAPLAQSAQPVRSARPAQSAQPVRSARPARTVHPSRTVHPARSFHPALSAGAGAGSAPAPWTWRGRRLLPLLWALYVPGLLIFTLLPLPRDPARACASIIHWDNYVPFGSLAAVVQQFQDGQTLRAVLYGLSIGLNVLLFMPLGALGEATRRGDGARGARSLWAWAGLGCALSCLIEFAQWTGLFGVVPCTYRVVDIDDVITNTLGTCLGAWLLPRLARKPWLMRG